MRRIIATVFCVLALAGAAWARATYATATFTSVVGSVKNGGPAGGDLLVTFSEAGLTPGATISYEISAVGTCFGVDSAVDRGFVLTANTNGVSQKADVQQPANCVGTTPVYSQGKLCDLTNNVCAAF